MGEMPMKIEARHRSLGLPLRLLTGIILVVAVTLAIFDWLMQPPEGEFWAMTWFLSATALLSLGLGYGVYRLGWLNRSPGLYWTLFGSYALSSVLTFLNVWVTARLMFINRHDLALATLLLTFAAGIAMVLGYFFSATLTDNIRALHQGANRIAQGHLDTRVHLPGHDEMAGLARSFNKMAAQLEVAARKQQEAETLRRDLIAWVGHDLRTPLASVRAIVEALADGMVEDPETRARYLDTARRSIHELALLIDDLFAMAQLDAGGFPQNRQLHSLTDLISDTLESFRELAHARGIHLEGAAEEGVDPVMMDARQIGRVLANLVNNGLRYTPPGGTVTIQARKLSGAVQVTVRDTGPGIAPEDLPHIFDQFYRGEKSRSRHTGGAGMGLAIARGFVENHGGKIWAESRPGQGTCIAFTLPAPGEAPPARHPFRGYRAAD